MCTAYCVVMSESVMSMSCVKVKQHASVISWILVHHFLKLTPLTHCQAYSYNIQQFAKFLYQKIKTKS